MRKARLAPALGALALVAALTLAATAGGGNGGFQTSEDPMLDCPSCGDDIVPIITVGDTIGSYRFEAIPDGVAINTARADDDDGSGGKGQGSGDFDLYVNHETSLVAFNYGPNLNPPVPPTASNSQNDFDNSQVSLLRLNGSNEIEKAQMVIGTSENYQRFCSNYIGTRREGFDRPILITNEEGQDWVRRTGLSWNQTIPAGTAGAEQIGVAVAHDVRNGKTRPIYGMGRLNHENSVPMPDYGKIVLITGDDTFSTSPASSQLYMYVADDSKALWNDEGKLYALAAKDSDQATDKNDYFDIQPNDDPVEMEFIEVPRMIATGKKAGNVDITRAADFPSLPAPPASIPDGPQWVLDQWGNLGNNTHGQTVFDFIRIEDTAYDKRPGESNVMYLADSGRGTATDNDPATPAPALNALSVSTNGRVWKLELDETNPLEAKLSVFIQGDDNPVKTVGEIHQPDNVETTAAGSFFVQEDPGSSQQFSPPFNQAGATTARIWRYDLNANTMAPVASVDQEADEGPTDEDATPEGSWGAWESSGIVDASSVLGPGWFFVTIQAHSLWVDVAPGPNVLAPDGPDWTYKREGGQLLAIRIPGA